MTISIEGSRNYSATVKSHYLYESAQLNTGEADLESVG